MKLYRLPLVMYEPSEDAEGKYRAEVPALSGYRAWGDTAAETLENLQGVVTAFIESYRARGDSLPPEVEQASSGSNDTRIQGEVLVAA